MRDYTPIHTTVWEKLDNLASENHHLKRANTKMRGELRRSRRELNKLRKQLKPEQQYKNQPNRRNGK